MNETQEKITTPPQVVTDPLEKAAHEIVADGDPRSLEAVKQFLSMDDESFLETAGAIKAHVHLQQAKFEEEVGPDRVLVRLAEAVALKRIIERGAKKLPSDTYRCEVTASKIIDKRIAGLLELFRHSPRSGIEERRMG